MKIINSAFAVFAGLGALLLAPASGHAADYQMYKDAVCVANSQCGIDFPAVPAGKRLTILHVSCYIRFNENFDLGAAQLVVIAQNGARIFAVTPNFDSQDSPRIGSTSQEVFTASEPVKAVAGPTQRIRTYAQVYNSSNGTVGTINQLSCGISGTLN